MVLLIVFLRFNLYISVSCLFRRPSASWLICSSGDMAWSWFLNSIAKGPSVGPAYFVSPGGRLDVAASSLDGGVGFEIFHRRNINDARAIGMTNSNRTIHPKLLRRKTEDDFTCEEAEADKEYCGDSRTDAVNESKSLL